VVEELGELLGYDELAVLLGKSRGSLRVMRSRGQLPDPDADGPRWRRSTIEGFLERGAAGVGVVSPGPSTKPADPDVERSSVPERRGERDRWADAQVRALQGLGERPGVAAPPVQEPAARPGSSPAVSPRPVPPPVVPSDPRQSMTPGEVSACEHPDGRRKSLGYMTVCQACGRRQQGDGWVGEGFAGWTPSERAGCPRHPGATRSALDPSRCAWGCKLPPG
jgi:hypothetical protein